MVCKYTFKSDLFKIMEPFASLEYKPGRKRKFNNEGNYSEEIQLVKEKFESIMSDKMNNIFSNNFESCEKEDNNLSARLVSKSHFETIGKNTSTFSGRNENDFSIVVEIFNEKYLIPAKSKFYCCNVFDLRSKLHDDAKFDVIVLDPPWWNKYIRRKRKKVEKEGYKMMFNDDISKIPVGDLLQNNGLVAMWCTNSANHLKSVKEEIFPSWGISYLSSWFWVKVTRGGETVCQFSQPSKKQPYERIVFGSVADRHQSLPSPEDNKLIISVPSAVHSHKPPLVDVLSNYLPVSPVCLELFARYLLPSWTSCGDQVLSLQSLNLYEAC
ncbi:N(6)-adenine-specific methyltransferase METTL4 isoform X1 [Nilaparvata lugens]|uniref:N(6)-adenine-specific methyltransferase METTL4 isoform X1 n=2 Tax=Nilaparvata lugens TaxID=108931 RepID=UPI00193D375E|nr:N(6)-adenine-specific methyltransferase METTL4 isoform X1 [Nilaparvata lugens]